MSRLAWLGLVLWLIAHPALLRADKEPASRPPASLSLVQRYYYEGRYKEALPVIQELRAQATDTKQQVKLLEIHALILYLLSSRAEAKAVWRELLALQPDHR